MEYELSNNVKAVETRIRAAEKLLLVDRSTFMHFDGESFNKTIISEIEDYLVREFKTREVINVEELFEQFEESLHEVKIHNKTHLYSVLNHFLAEKFMFGHGNTLNIYKQNFIQNVEEQLISYMKKKNGSSSINELSQVVKPIDNLKRVISSSKMIIEWGENHFILLEHLNLRNSEKESLILYFMNEFKSGYASASHIFKNMRYSPKFSKILKRISVDNELKLEGLIKAILSNVKGSSEHLYLSGYDMNSYPIVITQKFLTHVTSQEIKQFAEKNGIIHTKCNELLKRLVEDGLFIEIDTDKLYNAKHFPFSPSTLEKLKKLLDEKMGDEQYFSISKLRGYEHILPPVGFFWNPMLLKSFLVKCGFRQVEKLKHGHSFGNVIMVKEVSYIHTFEDLLIHIIQKEFTGIVHECKLYDFLVNKGILREQGNMGKNVLPQEIKMSNKFIFDEKGHVLVR